jgi:hypothetical protein
MGTNGTFKILGWIGSAVGFCLILYSMFYVPTVNAIAKEVECRQAADQEVAKEIGSKLDVIIQQNTDTKVALAGISQQVLVNTRRLDKIEDRVK